MKTIALFTTPTPPDSIRKNLKKFPTVSEPKRTNCYNMVTRLREKQPRENTKDNTKDNTEDDDRDYYYEDCNE